MSREEEIEKKRARIIDGTSKRQTVVKNRREESVKKARKKTLIDCAQQPKG